MRRVLLIMPLLVALVACGGNSTQPANGSALSTLTPAEVESKMASGGLCTDKPFREFEEDAIGILCTSNSKRSKGGALVVAIHSTRQEFLNEVDLNCQRRVLNDAWAYGENWLATINVTEPDAANVRKVAKTLGGAVAVDLSDLCKTFGF
jgi:hypothetical protein